MAEYKFQSIWKIDAPLEWVWDKIVDIEHWPTWWRHVARVEKLRPGDADGVGAVYRQWWRTELPYTFQFEARITRVQTHRLIEAQVDGELAGTGTWRLSENNGVTTAQYDWHVSTSKGWMNVLEPLARRVFAWNHERVMSEGERSLQHLLSAYRLDRK